MQAGIPQRLGIPIIGAIPALHKLRKPVNSHVFHIGVGDDTELAKIVEHIATLGIKRIGIVHRDEPSAYEAVALIEREAGKRLVDVVIKSHVEAGTDNVGGAVTAMINAKPSAIVAILPVIATGAFVKGLRKAKNATLVDGPSYSAVSVKFQHRGIPDAIR